MTEWNKDQLLARLIYEAAQQVGWASGAQTVVERVRRLAIEWAESLESELEEFLSQAKTFSAP